MEGPPRTCYAPAPMHIAKSLADHKARVRQLRKLVLVTLTSKKHFVCRAHHCTMVRSPGGAPAVPWPKKSKG
jgi:hypothetical protein